MILQLIICYLLLGSTESNPCSCNLYTNAKYCLGFGCYWDRNTQTCNEFTCAQRGANNLCFKMNQMLRTQQSPTYCSLSSASPNVTCVESPQNCNQISSILEDNCYYNSCQSGSGNCTTPAQTCPMSAQTCDGTALVNSSKALFGVCSLQDGSTSCSQTDLNTPCENIKDRKTCIILSQVTNCGWNQQTSSCMTLQCSDRPIMQCHYHYQPDIYHVCVPVGNQCQLAQVEILNRNLCSSTTIFLWDEFSNRCVSCDPSRWALRPKQIEDEYSENDSNSSDSEKRKQSIVIDIDNSHIFHGNTFVNQVRIISSTISVVTFILFTNW